MKAHQLLKIGLVLASFGAPGFALAPAAQPAPQERAKSSQATDRWNARMAEHLWNRAGFGASEAEVQRAVELGQAAFVDELLKRQAEVATFMPDHLLDRRRSSGRKRREMSEEERMQKRRDLRRSDREQARDFSYWWVQRMLDGEDPLGERMALFWHGHFTSSMEDVRNSYYMINQNELFRELGMGHFGELLGAVARDPAMLEYLDSRSNRKDSPNENFARELLELFTLGEGNYTEQDIKEAARAFTGWNARDGEFRLREREHDFGPKSFMGEQGDFGGDEIIGIVLQQDACSRYVVKQLITYFEGQPPTKKRLESYARSFRKSELHVGKLLRRLFMDPAFYRKEVIGNRIASPIDFMVGNARRLGLEDSAELIFLGAGILGQRLLNPPNVKGWDGGTAWISSSTMIHRGNLSGVLLGEISMRDFVDYDPDLDEEMANMDAMAMGAHDEMDEGGDMDDPDPMGHGALADDGMGSPDASDGMQGDDGEPQRRRPQLGALRGLRELRGARWRPRLRLTAHLTESGMTKDDEIINALLKRLLGVRVGGDTRTALVVEFKRQRKALGLGPKELLRDASESEPLLRSLAHLILSLPEAQLN